MTGSGTAAGPTPLGDLQIEVRSVNARALAVRQRLCAECQGLEGAFEEAIRRRFARGSFTIVAERGAGRPLAVDLAALKAAATQAVELCRELGLQPPALRDVLAVLGPSGPKTGWQPPPEVAALLERALDALAQHRQREGEATAAVFDEQLDALESALQQARARAPEVVDDYRDKLLSRVNAFLQEAGRPLEPSDVVREVALFADRADISEELERLRIHIRAARELLQGGGPVGRKLEFLLQEMLREANTLGSKSPDAELSQIVVTMKSCIDRLKEQAANLE